MSKVVAIPCLYYVETPDDKDAEVDAELLRAAWDAAGDADSAIELDASRLKPDMSRRIFSIDTYRADHNAENYNVELSIVPLATLNSYEEGLLAEQGIFKGVHSTHVLSRNRFEAKEIGVRRTLGRLMHSSLHDRVGVVVVAITRV